MSRAGPIGRSSTGTATAAFASRSARVVVACHAPDRRFTANEVGYRTFVFLFFSNRLGCLGSLLVSALLTVLLLVILGVL